jgi:hypothetical protein
VGRVGEDRVADVGVGSFLVGVGGAGEGLVFKFLSAARCGRGLMGRGPLFADEVETTADFCFSSFSLSSEVLRRRLVPARTVTGDGGLGCSGAAVLGRYLGNDEVVGGLAFFVRRTAARVRMPALGVLEADSGFGGGCSTDDGRAILVDTRRRVLALDSGVPVLMVV